MRSRTIHFAAALMAVGVSPPSNAVEREPPVSAAPAPPQAATMPTPRAELAVVLDGPSLAGFPVLFKLTITNRGEQPIPYWFAGPGHGPSADLFSMIVSDERGARRHLHLYNGQYTQGSGGFRDIKSHETFPAASDPLPVGRYTITVQGERSGYMQDGKLVETWPAVIAAPFEIEVVDDRAALAIAQNDMLARQETEPFVQHVCRRYGLSPEVQDWLETLCDEDIATARSVLGLLIRVRRLPDGGDRLLLEAARVHTSAEMDNARDNVLASIARIAGHTKTDAALEAAIIIARADLTIMPGENVRGFGRDQALRSMARFPQARAEAVLLEFARDENGPGSGAAISALGERGHRAAIQPLLKAAADPNVGIRVGALRSMTGLRNEPEIRRVLLENLQDSRFEIRHAAEYGLNGEPEFDEEAQSER